MQTPLHQLTEQQLIARIAQGIICAEDVIQGIGDDCAVFDTGGPEVSVISTDALVEGVHFDPFISPMPHIGFKAVSAAVSDIYAMFARPTLVTVSVSVSDRYTVEHLEQLYQGIKTACDYFGVSLVGGDTTRSLRDLFISVTVLGSAPREQIVYRSGATANEILCVTGDVGAAYAGLKILQRESAVLRQNPEAPLSFEGYEYVVERQLRPVPKRYAVQRILDVGLAPTACLDISDGLANDLYNLSAASDVGFRVLQEQIPLHEETKRAADAFGIPTTTIMLYGGEEYELLFTVPQDQLHLLSNLDFVTTIGFATEPQHGIQLVLPNQSVIPIERLGWEHFTDAKQE